jgi:hypothetical protein
MSASPLELVKDNYARLSDVSSPLNPNTLK